MRGHKNKIWLAIVLFLSALVFALNVFFQEEAQQQPVGGVTQEASQRTGAP